MPVAAEADCIRVVPQLVVAREIRHLVRQDEERLRPLEVARFRVILDELAELAVADAPLLSEEVEALDLPVPALLVLDTAPPLLEKTREIFGKFVKDEAERCNLKGTKPFFILTHKMTYFACNHQLREYPNAIGFCGHWHSSMANWDSNIMYKRNYKLFPYINCGACRYDGGNGLSQDCMKEKPATWSDADYHFQYPSRQGLVVSVYNDKYVVMDRREFFRGGRIGPPWVFPIGQFETKPYSRETLATKIGNPEFRPKAKIQTYMDTVATNGKVILPKRVEDLIAHMYRKPERKDEKPSMWIEIPMADGNRKSRVFSYDIVIMADDDPKNRYFKSVFFAGVGFGEGHEDNDGITLVDVPIEKLPKGKELTIAVRPVSSLGTKGKTIGTTLKV